jgi:uncharacterized membrane protein YfcA
MRSIAPTHPPSPGAATNAPAHAPAVAQPHHLRRALLVVLLLWAVGELRDINAMAAGGDASLQILIVAIVGLSALLSSVAGFAFSALAGSCFAYLPVERVHAVQTIVTCSTAIQLYGVWRIRASIRWRPLWPMLAAGTVAVPAGVWMLVHVASTVYITGLGAFLAVYGCYALLARTRRVVRGSAWRDAIAGALGGFAGGLAGLSGSFVTIWCSMRGWDKRQQRAVFQPFILVMQIVTLGWIALQVPGSVHAAEDLQFIPFALLGAVGGLAVFDRITGRQFQLVISALLIVSGAGLLCRAL